MKKRVKNTSRALIAGLLFSSAFMAWSQNTHDIQYECRHTASQLNNMADSNATNPCSGDLKIAAAYIESAQLKLKHQKTDQALIAIKYGELELKEISQNRSYCSAFSNRVKPIIASVIKIGSEIEVLEQLKRLQLNSESL